MNVFPVYSENFNAAQFAELVKTRKHLINKSEIVPVVSERKNLVAFHVIYNRPVYKPIWGFKPISR